MNNIAFITGSAGFIGFHLCSYLLINGWKVIGLDGITNYYDIKLKKDRHEILKKNKNFLCNEALIQDRKLLNKICNEHKPKIFIHLAAQAGVRYSISNPQSYVESNLQGTFYILELAKKFKPDHLILASTSSVYGDNELPFHENQNSDTPISFYAATKKSNEVMAHSYSHLYDIPTTVLRFFTVYGPWGRPDMALFKFTKNILLEKPIHIFNKGNMKRDFTNIHDLVEAMYLLLSIIPQSAHKRTEKIKNDSISSSAPYRIVNIGNSKSVNLLEYVLELEKVLGKSSKKKFLEKQDGDVQETFSDISLLYNLTNFSPKVSLKEGITEFVEWYKYYYH